MATTKPERYPRWAREAVLAALADTPVVAVNGPRQAGKSTFVGELLGIDAEYVTLDDDVQREAARNDPVTFIRDRGSVLVIDEVQRVPDLFLAIKAEVDRRRTPGRFVLTGSTRLLTTPRISESLAGRVEFVDLLPLSRGELAGVRETFVDAAFAGELSTTSDTPTDRDEYFGAVAQGGFPEAVRRAGTRRDQWFENYATTILQRAVLDVADIARGDLLSELARVAAGRTATELNTQTISDTLGIPYRTLGAYLGHLQTVFLVQLVPAWTRNVTAKVVRRPKLHFVDSGLASYLVDADEAFISRNPIGGQLLESFVAMELCKQIGWSRTRPRLSHFRDRDGAEVDLIMESRRGQVVGCEVKASATVRSEDFRGLRVVAERLGDAFLGGYVLYTGSHSVRFGPKLTALPIAALWAPRRVE